MVGRRRGCDLLFAGFRVLGVGRKASYRGFWTSDASCSLGETDCIALTRLVLGLGFWISVH